MIDTKNSSGLSSSEASSYLQQHSVGSVPKEGFSRTENFSDKWLVQETQHSTIKRNSGQDQTIHYLEHIIDGSTASHLSEARSSGYYSNPRSWHSQLSILDSIVDSTEHDGTTSPVSEIQQTNIDKDEGLSIDSSIEYNDDSEKKSSEAQCHGGPDQSDLSMVEDLTPFRPRCYQLESPSVHIHSQKKRISELDLPIRSHSFPTTGRHLHNKVVYSTIHPQHLTPNTSTVSLDSESTGSQLSYTSFSNDDLLEVNPLLQFVNLISCQIPILGLV